MQDVKILATCNIKNCRIVLIQCAAHNFVVAKLTVERNASARNVRVRKYRYSTHQQATKSFLAMSTRTYKKLKTK